MFDMFLSILCNPYIVQALWMPRSDQSIGPCKRHHVILQHETAAKARTSVTENARF